MTRPVLGIRKLRMLVPWPTVIPTSGVSGLRSQGLSPALGHCYHLCSLFMLLNRWKKTITSWFSYLLSAEPFNTGKERAAWVEARDKGLRDL